MKNLTNTEQQLKHLSLPKGEALDMLIIGDSIVKRIIRSEVSNRTGVRGYGGAKSDDILERISNTRKKEVKMLTISVGINDVLSNNFDLNQTVSTYEKIFHKANNKFEPDVLHTSTICHINYRYAAKNETIAKLKNKVNVVSKSVKFHSNTQCSALEISGSFHKEHYRNKDGLHANLDGIRHFVNCCKSALETWDLPTSDLEITLRKPPR